MNSSTVINNLHRFIANSINVRDLVAFLLVTSSAFSFSTSTYAVEKKAPKNTPATTSSKTDSGKFEELKLTAANVWRCENNVIVKTAESSQGYLMLWNNKLYIMNKIDALSGVNRYTSNTYNLNWIEIPDKAMLFDFKSGQRVLDYCKTPELASQAPSKNQEDLLK